MAKIINVDGREYRMYFPISAQQEVIDELGLKDFTAFSDEKTNAEIIGSPLKVAKVAYIGIKAYARRHKEELTLTFEEMCDGCTSVIAAMEQFMADYVGDVDPKK